MGKYPHNVYLCGYFSMHSASPQTEKFPQLLLTSTLGKYPHIPFYYPNTVDMKSSSQHWSLYLDISVLLFPISGTSLDMQKPLHRPSFRLCAEIPITRTTLGMMKSHNYFFGLTYGYFPISG